MKIGFVGVGDMGGPMCRNVIKNSGHEVTVFDLNPEAVEQCVAVGGKAATSLASLAADSDIIMTSLPMPKDVEAVALGAGGIAENAKAGTLYFDLSTNSPLVVRRIAEALEPKGIKMLDAPVSGGVIGAEKGTIAIMVGGDKALFDDHLPIFESFGQNIIHTGEIGSGCVAKIVNNMVAFCNFAAGAEGLMLGAKAGIDPEILNQVIRNSSGNSMGFRAVAKKTLAGDWSASFTVDLAYKDMHLALELADEIGVPLSLSPQVHNLMRMARGMGYGDNDAVAIMRVYEETLGFPVRK
jgi:3-hydroxyisobutyrate dehydrogenase-like beta-hydroxyacid dehydrogenase